MAGGMAAHFGDDVDGAAGTGEDGNPGSTDAIRSVVDPARTTEEAESRGAGTLSAELEDSLKSRLAGEASGAAPRRLGGLLLGLLANDDDDDILDEEVGENGDGGGYEDTGTGNVANTLYALSVFRHSTGDSWTQLYGN